MIIAVGQGAGSRRIVAAGVRLGAVHGDRTAIAAHQVRDRTGRLLAAPVIGQGRICPGQRSGPFSHGHLGGAAGPGSGLVIIRPLCAHHTVVIISTRSRFLGDAVAGGGRSADSGSTRIAVRRILVPLVAGDGVPGSGGGRHADRLPCVAVAHGNSRRAADRGCGG